MGNCLERKDVRNRRSPEGQREGREAGKGQQIPRFTALLRTGPAVGWKPVDSGGPAVSHTCPLHPLAAPWPLPLGPESSFVTQHGSGGCGLSSS